MAPMLRCNWAMATLSFHVSHNRLFGSIEDTSIDSLLASCAEHLITGTLDIEGPAGSGSIVLRAGAADTTRYADLEGERALVALRELRAGSYELAQRLPALDGAIGSAAECHGDISHSSIVEMMNHCENQALSCTITIINEFDRAEICYRAGDIDKIFFNGREDADAVVEIVGWRRGKFRVSVPPLPADIGGWPSAGREPTVPFKIADVAKLAPKPKPKRRATQRSLPGVREAWSPRDPLGDRWAPSRARTVDDAPLPDALWRQMALPTAMLVIVWAAILMTLRGL